MPDVTRSDSQKSDASLRPRVSFNRDVHVKRIVPRDGSRVVGALNNDGEAHTVTSPVRKERLSYSKLHLAKEAARVIHQADKLDCISTGNGVHPEKFYTLPARKNKHLISDYPQNSLDRRSKRRNSEELVVPPKKPPRTFASHKKNPERSSVFTIFQKPEAKPKKSNLRRSASDSTSLKTHEDDVTYKTTETEEPQHVRTKKQLSPIIEDNQREDYFTPNLKASTSFKENNKNVENVLKAPVRKKTKKLEKTQTVTEKLKEYIDEVDTALFEETGHKPKREYKQPEIVIIDVEKAEKIKSNKPKFSSSAIGKKLKAITNKKSNKNKTKEVIKQTASSVINKQTVEKSNPVIELNDTLNQNNTLPKTNKRIVQESNTSPRIQEAIRSIQTNKSSPIMIHSSQKPVEKLPLTRGRTVDTMIKRLSHESTSPPLKTSIMISPHVSVQHNNNKPFSYTRGVSPERSPTSPTSPIIYAQVVCGSNGNGTKQTVHTAFTNGKKQLPHSDSDEGLGYEENSGFRSSEKSMTHFGDEKYKNDYNKNEYIKNDYNKNEFINDDRFDEEFPITPKFKSNGYNGFGSYEKYSKDPAIFIDSSSRGRGDGMDSKRRESLTEPNENGQRFNGSNARKDLSARRDLLESRINRRFGEKRNSPEYSPKTGVYRNDSRGDSRGEIVLENRGGERYYRSGSASPIGFKEKYVTETKIDRQGNQYTTNSHTKKYLGDSNGYNIKEYRYNYDNEPKSFDSQNVSDYRSSPENVRHFETSQKSSSNRYTAKNDKLSKDRNYYKSNPEINQQRMIFDTHGRYKDTYHDSLKREKIIEKDSERYFEDERKDKFGDSGIENDFRRDSGERRPKRREFSNESDDEGFASSLLIASERQHTEDNFARKNRRGYESDRGYPDDPYRHNESMQYKSYKTKNEYAPRERSIDDGSHFDPRIDKNDSRSSLKKVDSKPPKPEKKSSLEKMKQLFSVNKKKKTKPGMVREESLRARYTEYKGNHQFETKFNRKEASDVNTGYDYNNRRRLSTPSPSPTRENQRNGKTDPPVHTSWFKSLDRLARKKPKKGEKEGNLTSTEDEITKPTKSLRFFGDTDIESNDSIRHKSALKSRSALSHRDRIRSQSSRDLHNISEETHKSNHKSMLNISAGSDRDVKGSRMSLKPPASPSHRNLDRNREVSRSRDDRGRRRKNEVSSVESSTEGDSSQQSQRSIVYLHAATVGDIPGPGYLRNGRRAASREELTSNTSSHIQPQVKTLSRSFSVLAPWKPRHYREGMDIDYTQYPKPIKNGKYEQNKTSASRKDSSSTLKKKAQETKRSTQNVTTLNRKSRSKENISTLKRASESKGSTSSLYKKKDRQPKEHNRYNRDDKQQRSVASKSMSVESLGSRNGSSRKGEVSRSISMPRDPEKSAGWFNINKKSNKKAVSTQRL